MAQQVCTADINSGFPLLQKREAAWEGLRLEHYRFCSGELPQHCHPEHTVLISLSDGCPAEMRTGSGLRIVGTQRRGSVCVLPSGLTHKAQLGGPSEHVGLYVDPSLINRAAAGSNFSSRYEIAERYSLNDPIIAGIGSALLAELDSEGISGRLYAESLANVLAVHLLRHYTTEGHSQTQQVGGLSSSTLRRVINFISDNFADDISLAQLAQIAGMSSFHFAREFKKATGTTPHQYLIKFRVEHARTLLADNKLPLVEVGLRAGFSHQSHFTRLFRKITGTTPHSYRVALQT
jgi:AraC family transcriptional regulator